MTRVCSPLGLIAGQGVFPLLVARGAIAAGRPIVCASLGGFAPDELRMLSIRHRNVGLMRIGEWIRLFQSTGVRDAIMVGRVPKEVLYKYGRVGRWLKFVPDLRTIRLYQIGRASCRERV